MPNTTNKRRSFDFLHRHKTAKPDVELPGYLKELQRAPSADSRHDFSAFIGRKSMDEGRGMPRDSVNEHSSSNAPAKK
jgi:hypothetical protein